MLLAGKQATYLAELRFWKVMGMGVFEDIPDDYMPSVFGPADPVEPAEVAVDDPQSAMSAGAELRGELFD